MSPTLSSRRSYLQAALGASSMGLAGVAFAQGKNAASAKADLPLPSGWPNKPFRLVVPYPAGGLTDAYARMYAEQLTAKFSVPAVVDNKPGAGAIIGIDAVAKAPADGHTLLVTVSGTVWQNRVLYNKLPYNLDKDLAPIAMFPSGPLVVAVNENVPAQNMQEFIEFAKKQRTAIGTYGAGTYPQMIATELNRSNGTNILPVHYRGEAPMWVDLASGQVQIAVGSFMSFNTVQTRGVRPIAVTGSYRSPRLPQIKTMTEQGIGGRLVALEGALPLLAPAGTPEAILQALSRVAVEGAATERAAKLRENFAIPNSPKNLADTRREWNEVVPVWIKHAVDLNIKLD
jgi:tripartite-type tricarboxylate transporter receptor subunit TctC